jgi:hypothetical protein
VWAVTELYKTKKEKDEVLAKDKQAKAKLNQETIVKALNDLFDSTAQEKQYDDRFTCAMRAGYKGPYQAECTAFAVWMDKCNELSYKMFNISKQETVETFLSSLPKMVWPK